MNAADAMEAGKSRIKLLHSERSELLGYWEPLQKIVICVMEKGIDVLRLIMANNLIKIFLILITFLLGLPAWIGLIDLYWWFIFNHTLTSNIYDYARCMVVIYVWIPFFVVIAWCVNNK